MTYEPSSAGRLISAIDSGIGVTYAGGVLYAPQGALEYATHGAAGLNRSLVYNNRLQPSLVTVGTPGQTVMSLAYEFDGDPGPGVANNGNVHDIFNNLDGGRTQHFTYDELNRLKTAWTEGSTGPNCFGLEYGYDIWANLHNTTVTKCAPFGRSFTINAATNRIESAGGITFGYDNAGNLTADGSFNYAYDAENRLTSVNGGSTATYSYDGDGQRVQKSSGTLYWYGPGGEVLQETDAAGTLLRDFIYFNGQRVARREANNTVYFFFSDHLGSARVVTDASGGVVEESDFYPFGREIVITDLLQGSQDNPYKFTGQERDPETSLDYFGARHYSLTLGRFLQPDPVSVINFQQMSGLEARRQLDRMLRDPQRWNMYTYSLNNPLRYTDPTGEVVVSAEDVKREVESRELEEEQHELTEFAQQLSQDVVNGKLTSTEAIDALFDKAMDLAGGDTENALLIATGTAFDLRGSTGNRLSEGSLGADSMHHFFINAFNNFESPVVGSFITTLQGTLFDGASVRLGGDPDTIDRNANERGREFGARLGSSNDPLRPSSVISGPKPSDRPRAESPPRGGPN